MLGNVGAVYLSSSLYIYGQQRFVWTFARQRKCGVRSTVVLRAMLCCIVIVSTLVLSTDLCISWCSYVTI